MLNGARPTSPAAASDRASRAHVCQTWRLLSAPRGSARVSAGEGDTPCQSLFFNSIESRKAPSVAATVSKLLFVVVVLFLPRLLGWASAGRSTAESLDTGRGGVVLELLHAPAVVGVERVYLMTTNSAGFYRQLGFKDADPQQLMVLRR